MLNFFEFCQVLNEGRPQGGDDQYIRMNPNDPNAAPDTYTGRTTSNLPDQGRKLSAQVGANNWKQAVEERPELAAYTQAAKALSAERKAGRAGAVPESDVVRKGNRVTATIPAHTKAIEGHDAADMAKRIDQLILSTPELLGKTMPAQDFERLVKDAYTKQYPAGGTESFLDHGEHVHKALVHLLKNGRSMGYIINKGMVTTPKGGQRTPEGASKEGHSSDFASNRGEQKIGQALTSAYEKLQGQLDHYSKYKLTPEKLARQPDIKETLGELRQLASLSIKGGWSNMHSVNGMNPEQLLEKLDQIFTTAKPVAGAEQPKAEATEHKEDTWLDLYEAMETFQHLGSRA